MKSIFKVVMSLPIILLLTAQSALSQVLPPGPGCNFKDDCSCVYQEDKAIVQLKYLGDYIKKQKEGYLTVTHGDDTYNFNPCTPFTIQPSFPVASKNGGFGEGCVNVVACQHHPLLYDIGSLQWPSTFTSNKEGNVDITYQAKNYQRHSTVTCICDTSYTGMPKFTSQGQDLLSNNFLFKMRHACCCKDTCKDGMPPGSGAGLSGGSVLLIIVLVLVLVYLVLGGLFMKYKRGAIGSEIIPNKSFWGGLPALIKDGVLFVLSPCTKRGNYSQV